ncbi:septum formation initiator family protein [bacterium]|nr:septum formation initiator family protein [bacterium]
MTMDAESLLRDEALLLKKKKRRKIVLWAVAVIASLTVIGGNYGLYQIMKINNQRSALVQSIEKLKQEQTALLQEREKLKSDLKHIEKVAREKYGMVREGERVYQVIPKDKKQ